MNKRSSILLTAAVLLAALPARAQMTQTFTAGGESFEMILLMTDTFMMGATPEQKEAENNEYPAHLVTLGTYMIGKTEVTQALWQAVMGDNPSLFTAKAYPVESVSYQDCLDFIARLNQMTGKQFRLPTEAEWEYAARGGDQAKGEKYGVSDSEPYSWFNENSDLMPHAVGSRYYERLGLRDMCGNVAEWCSDWMGSYPSAEQNNPKGPASGTQRVCRGGGWGDVAWRCRTSARDAHAPSYKSPDLGFRLAMSVAARSRRVNNPEVKGTNNPSLKIKSVILTEGQTVLKGAWTNPKSYSTTCYMSSGAVLKDRATGKSYTVTKMDGITSTSGQTYVGGNSTVEFTLYFPPLPENVEAIDFIESSSSNWNTYDIRLK